MFFGTADFSVPSLEALLGDGYTVAVAVTKPDTPGKRGTERMPPHVKKVAQDHGIPVIQPESKDQLAEKIGRYPDIDWGVVAAYGMIIPATVLDRFKGGLVNVHASLLPRWRGPSPIEAAILHGDDRTGISLMRLVAAMDAGPVYIQKTIGLDGTETRLWLQQRLAELGAETLRTHLDEIINGTLTPEEQDDSRATYTKLLGKSDGEIDWQQPAESIERRIRAFRGWPGSFTTIENVRVTIESARVIEAGGKPGNPDIIDGSLVIYASEKALLIDELRPSGKKTMSGQEFLRGYLKP